MRLRNPKDGEWEAVICRDLEAREEWGYGSGRRESPVDAAAVCFGRFVEDRTEYANRYNLKTIVEAMDEVYDNFGEDISPGKTFFWQLSTSLARGSK